MMDYGLVSVIMPTYNCGKFINESIESVKKQTYTNWELIIVDDCSADNTDEVVEPYLADSRVYYYKNPRNTGAAVSRNFALSKANGRWMAFLDSDDLWYEDKLEKQLSFMIRNNYSFSTTACEDIDENGIPLSRATYRPKKVGKIGMTCYCWPGCLTVIYDRDVVGLIQIANIKKNNDYALWLKVIEKAKCYGLNEILGKYRIRNGSIAHDRGKLGLVKYYYVMWVQAENKPIAVAFFLTLVNSIFAWIKRIFYVKRI